jgi:Endonuclease NucS
LKLIPLPTATAFVKHYGSDHSYWYFPKGRSVSDVNTLQECLTILKRFEGGKPWRDVQADYIAALNSAAVSQASDKWEGGGAPFARMLVQVFRILGLAWVDGSDLVEITKAGNLLIEGGDPAAILSRQMERYQFYNPSVSSREHQSVQLHPLPFLAEVMALLQPQVISSREFELFISKAKSHDQVERVAEQIEAWRAMSPEDQARLVAKLDKYMVGGVGRRSIRHTISLDRPYATAALALSRLIVRRNDGGVEFMPGGLRSYRQFLRNFDSDHAYVSFRSEKDWIAYIGDPDIEPTRQTALDYYVKIGDSANAIAVKKADRATASELKHFKDMLVAEKKMEDYLASNLDQIGRPLGVVLELVGRQYATTVGPIDLLCRNRSSGQYVVVELKKDRSADKVFGQISRYMGWVKANLAGGGAVAGVIVARSFDDKIKAARHAHATDIKLIEFAMKVGARQVE